MGNLLICWLSALAKLVAQTDALDWRVTVNVKRWSTMGYVRAINTKVYSDEAKVTIFPLKLL